MSCSSWLVARSLALAAAMHAWLPCVFALNPELDVSQYAHTAWKVHDGFFRGEVYAIAQTPDGYLWLGTEFEVERFDGVRIVPWQPPGQALPPSSILKLLVARDGTLWLGTSKGLASWKDGKLTVYPELAGQFIYSLAEDRDATVWVGVVAMSPPGRLCAIQKSDLLCTRDERGLENGVFSLYEDARGTLWAGTKSRLWRWKPGPREFFSLPADFNGIQSVGEDSRGALLVTLKGGLRQFVDGRTQTYSVLRDIGPFEATRILRDRDGNLWIGTQDRGLVHVHGKRVDVFGPTDGLSGARVYAIFEDREGNIWAATSGGLDRFRDFAVSTVSAKQGLPNSSTFSVLAARDGSIWFGTQSGLYRWDGGRIAAYGTHGGRLGGGYPQALLQDDQGRIWVATRQGFGYLSDGEFVSIPGIPGGVSYGVVEDRSGNLWIANRQAGLIRLSSGNVVQRIPWARLGHEDPATALRADRSRGGLWVGFFKGGVSYLAESKGSASYAAADGVAVGRVNDLQVDSEDVLWIGAEGGLSRLKNGHASTLTSRNGLPCDEVDWVSEDDRRSLWLKMSCGLVRIARADLNAWTDAIERDQDAARTIHVTAFDSSDGVISHGSGGGGFAPHVTASQDGRLWFAPWDGFSVIDPHHLPFNKLPPPVHIERVTVDRKTYEPSPQMRLPALVRDLQIDYTALSLVAPGKVLFRYKLEGRDRDWQDAGNRRQAFYSDLAPGSYRFHVIACNNSGVWNEQGDVLDFSVAPAYWQTGWFRALCAAAFIALLWFAYWFRTQQLARHFNLTLEARVEERTRIARELHDTLLQSFQGLLLRFQTAYQLFPTRPAEAGKILGTAIDRAASAITEGRDAVQGLRSSAIESNDLAPAIRTLGEELAAEQAGPDCAAVSVVVEGAPRPVHPILRDEIYRIATEALRNAFRHAQAKQIEVELRYDERQLRLRVRDDGKGIDPKFLSDQGREGHFGLHGMRERAKLMGGKLTVWSALDSGTEAELSIPASRAYATADSTRRSWLAKR